MIKLDIPHIQLPFEMLTIPAPSGYENALTMFYGWREFQITHKHGTFFDTEHSYKDYISENQYGRTWRT